RTNPRFGEQALRANLRLAETVKEIAAEKGVTPAQLALAWVLAQGDDIVPIPGTKRVRYLEENMGALSVTLTARDLKNIAARRARGISGSSRFAESKCRKFLCSSAHFDGSRCKKIHGAHRDQTENVAAIAKLTWL